MRILIVKLSSLGDVVHAMPAVQDIRAARPDAQIDWVTERGFVPLAQRCDGVRRVIACELRRWRKAPLGARTRIEWRGGLLAHPGDERFLEMNECRRVEGYDPRANRLLGGTRAVLAEMGHALVEREELSGDVQAILIRRDQWLEGCADPRRGGAARGATPTAARGGV